MKKISIVAVLLMLLTSVKAQTNDTIRPSIWSAGWTTMWTEGTSKTVALKGSSGNYAFGINNYADQGVAQQFDARPTTTNVLGTLMWVGAVSGTGNIDMKVWTIGGDQAYIYSVNLSNTVGGAPGPDVVKASKTINISSLTAYTSIQTGGDGPDRAQMNPIMFTTPAVVPANTAFAVGFEHALTTTGKSLGIMSSVDGQYGVTLGTNKAFVKATGVVSGQVGYKWFSYPATVPATAKDYSLCIFPIIQSTPAGIEDVVEANGLKLITYPNPATEKINVAYEVNQFASHLIVNVVDNSGRIVYTNDMNNQNTGTYSIELNVANYAAGNYFVTIDADGNRMAKIVSIVR